jgi:hypothetical protein
MSWDICLKNKNNKITAEIGKYTYNVNPMYQKAMGISLSDLNNMSTKQAIPILLKGVEEMINNKKEYIKLNPVNGWGNYDGALKYLESILKGCQKHYKSYISIE